MRQNRKGSNNTNNKSRNRVVKEQPRKDSNSKRINADNERVSKIRAEIEKDGSCKEANDISWYSKNPELLRSAGSFPFSSVLGMPVYNQRSVPGIMKIAFSPMVGGADGIPVNQAFDSMFSYLVHANSRNYNYNSPDLGILVLAASQVFSAISALTRAYGVVKYYTERNYFLPKAMLQAMGFYPDDIRENLGSLWFSLNNLVDQTRQIWVPISMPIFDRWIWLNGNIFTDAPGVTSQSYVFVQEKFYKYSETASPTGGMLIPVTEKDTGFSDAGTPFNPAAQMHTVKQWIQGIQVTLV